jgi:ribosomal protein L37AE/L43A
VHASSPQPSVAAPGERRRGLRTLAEGKRFEAYVEQQTSEMRVCTFCEKVFYRRKPMKQIGHRWVCIDCLKALKETFETLDRWEEMSVLHAEMERDAPGAFKR